MINIIKDPKTGITDVIHLCFECDPNEFPKGKPIVNDLGATKDLNTGKWSCSSCNEERINKGRIKRLGVNHPDVQYIIKAEDRKVLRHNDAARRLNEVSGQYLMKYRKNKYTGSMPLSPSSTTPTVRKTIGERVIFSPRTKIYEKAERRANFNPNYNNQQPTTFSKMIQEKRKRNF